MKKTRNLKKQIVLFLTTFVFLIHIPISAKNQETPLTSAQTIAMDRPVPKYIFLFIGDGMGFSQVAAYNIYQGTKRYNFRGTVKNPTPENPPKMFRINFTDFPSVGAVTTYDSSSFITDSASAATAIACGQKTLDGQIGLDRFKNKIPSVAERLKKEKDYKIGVITSVSLNHATPAGFYAHVPSRKNLYDIADQLSLSNFDFFGGGGIKEDRGKNNDQASQLNMAKKRGYQIANTKADIEKLNQKSGKCIAISPRLMPSSDMPYEIDRKKDELQLSDFVKKGIEVIDNEKGFFMMVESGKIDWACHCNDAYTVIKEMEAFERAIDEALHFYHDHPNETLILVTGDHETGGMGMGFNSTAYDTYFHLLDHQKISYSLFTDEIISQYGSNRTTFQKAMEDVKELFGLLLQNDPDAAKNPQMVINQEELKLLKNAFEACKIPENKRTKDEIYRFLYTESEYDPFQLMVTRILSAKAGIGWTTTQHTGMPLGIYAIGQGAEHFDGYIDNTDICNTLLKLCKVSN